MPVLSAGDVNARVWMRIREVEQSLSLDRADSCRAAGGPIQAALPAGSRWRARRHGTGRRFPRRRLVWLRIEGDRDRALPSARSVLVPVAAAGSRDRGQHRRRLPALQQIVQLLLFGPRSLGCTHAQDPVRKSRAPATDRSGARHRTTPCWPSSPPASTRAARRRLGRSLSIREVDAGSCNGCELEIHALNNAFYDLERFGLRFVASPRHADVLLVTGPVTKNMREALERTYNATPDPKWVVAVGDCALDGGIFAGSYAVVGGVAAVMPVDLHIPGCPPTPGPTARRPARADRAGVIHQLPGPAGLGPAKEDASAGCPTTSGVSAGGGMRRRSSQ